MSPSYETLERLVLYCVDYYTTIHQSGSTPIEINWMLGQKNEALEEIESVLRNLEKKHLIASRGGLYYCLNLYGLDISA